MNISVLPNFTLSKEIVLEETCTAIVVEPTQVVLLDVSHCPQMVRKYWDITKIHDVLHAEKKLKKREKDDKDKKSAKDVWEREALPQAGNGAEGGSSESATKGEGAAVADNEAAQSLPTPPPTASPPPPPPATDAHTEEHHEDTSHPESSPQDGIKFFAPLVRAPIPIGRRNADGSVGILNPGEVSGKSDSGVAGVKVGQLVTCKVVVNWGLQRSPVMVCDVEPTASAMVTPAAAPSAATATTAAVDVPAIAKMRGTVQRVKTRIKGGGSDGTGYELTEIVLTSLVSSAGEEVGIVLPQPVFFFCDNREVKPLEEINRDSMQVGDEVEFLGITAINVAVGAAILPKKVVESGVSELLR